MTTVASDIAWETAKHSLSKLVEELAKEKAHQVGFGWVGLLGAPSTYEDLVMAYEASKETGQPLPISNQYCDLIIYDQPTTNIAMRFWHDTAHVHNRLNFSVGDELELGLWHMNELIKRGIKKDSLVYRMLEVDILGQNYLQAVAKRFPKDQRQFVLNCLEMGLHEGVALEARADE